MKKITLLSLLLLFLNQVFAQIAYNRVFDTYISQSDLRILPCEGDDFIIFGTEKHHDSSRVFYLRYDENGDTVFLNYLPDTAYSTSLLSVIRDGSNYVFTTQNQINCKITNPTYFYGLNRINSAGQLLAQTIKSSQLLDHITLSTSKFIKVKSNYWLVTDTGIFKHDHLLNFKQMAVNNYDSLQPVDYFLKVNDNRFLLVKSQSLQMLDSNLHMVRSVSNMNRSYWDRGGVDYKNGVIYVPGSVQKVMDTSFVLINKDSLFTTGFYNPLIFRATDSELWGFHRKMRTSEYRKFNLNGSLSPPSVKFKFQPGHYRIYQIDLGHYQSIAINDSSIGMVTQFPILSSHQMTSFSLSNFATLEVHPLGNGGQPYSQVEFSPAFVDSSILLKVDSSAWGNLYTYHLEYAIWVKNNGVPVIHKVEGFNSALPSDSNCNSTNHAVIIDGLNLQQGDSIKWIYGVDTIRGLEGEISSHHFYPTSVNNTIHGDTLYKSKSSYSIPGGGDPMGLIDENVSSLQLYPNPTSGIFELIISSEITSSHLEVNIVNSRGEKVFKSFIHSNNASTKLDLSGYPSGMYLLLLKNNGEIIDYKKLLIAN